MRRLAAICLVMTTTLGACAVEETVARPEPLSVKNPYPGITILMPSRTVEIQAWTCRDSGPLIQVACAADTREHESLLVVSPQPSEIRAALHMAGYAQGAPGRWIRQDGEPWFIPPIGAAIEISVRCEPRPGQLSEEPISKWLRHVDDAVPFPGDTWIFGGSHRVETPAWVGGGEQLEADLTGSVIGLATFGDELLGFPQGLEDPDQDDQTLWAIRTPRVPPIGTPVTLVLRPADSGW